MKSIKHLNEKIREELHLREEDYEETGLEDDAFSDMEDDFDEEGDELEQDSKARIRLETESKIKGIIKNLDFEVDFRDLADRVNGTGDGEGIDGVVLTREKAHQLFNIFRDVMGF
jgi:hypothetical protein